MVPLIAYICLKHCRGEIEKIVEGPKRLRCETPIANSATARHWLENTCSTFSPA